MCIFVGNYALFTNEEHPTPGVEADLISPWYGESGVRCNVTFLVILAGINVGRLELMVLTLNGARRTVWFRASDQGTQ